MRELFVLIFVVCVYGNCISAAYLNERHDRSLFVIRVTRKEQINALAEDNDMNRYRNRMQENRRRIGSHSDSSIRSGGSPPR